MFKTNHSITKSLEQQNRCDKWRALGFFLFQQWHDPLSLLLIFNAGDFSSSQILFFSWISPTFHSGEKAHGVEFFAFRDAGLSHTQEVISNSQNGHRQLFIHSTSEATYRYHCDMCINLHEDKTIKHDHNKWRQWTFLLINTIKQESSTPLLDIPCVLKLKYNRYLITFSSKACLNYVKNFLAPTSSQRTQGDCRGLSRLPFPARDWPNYRVYAPWIS